MKSVAATPDMLDAIWDDLSQLHKTEMRTLEQEYGLEEGGSKTVCDAVVRSFGATALLDGSKVLCVGGWATMPNDLNTKRMFFLASNAFFENTLRNIRAVRKHFDQLLVDNPNATFTVQSFTRHPKAAKWAKCIGFNNVEREDTVLRFTKSY
jgi:hypothetical protein